jgi:hypothetical protein
MKRLMDKIVTVFKHHAVEAYGDNRYSPMHSSFPPQAANACSAS